MKHQLINEKIIIHSGTGPSQYMMAFLTQPTLRRSKINYSLIHAKNKPSPSKGPAACYRLFVIWN